MANFAFYQDSNLTTLLTGNNMQIPEGVSNAQVYFGSTNSSYKLQRVSSPGIDSILVTVADANPGSGAEALWIKLSITYSGLDTAVAGADLNLGSTIYGGVANAIPFWIRVSNALTGASSSTDLSISISDVKEFTV
jgi:hypothetical protein